MIESPSVMKIFLCILIFIIFTSCKKDAKKTPNENENIVISYFKSKTLNNEAKIHSDEKIPFKHSIEKLAILLTDTSTLSKEEKEEIDFNLFKVIIYNYIYLEFVKNKDNLRARHMENSGLKNFPRALTVAEKAEQKHIFFYTKSWIKTKLFATELYHFIELCREYGETIYAISEDGSINFQKAETVFNALVPKLPPDQKGIENPKLTALSSAKTAFFSLTNPETSKPIKDFLDGHIKNPASNIFFFE